MVHRMRQNKSTDLKIKNKIKDIIEGKTVTITMSLVTIYALVGDDIRVWMTRKEADPVFFAGLLVSFILFAAEILLQTIVIDEFKYSFFFWLDIIATLSLIPDILWITDVLEVYILNSKPHDQRVNVILGQIQTDSDASRILTKVSKSLRLIRLIRIIKLYKYITKSGDDKDDDSHANKKKKKKKVGD